VEAAELQPRADVERPRPGGPVDVVGVHLAGAVEEGDLGPAGVDRQVVGCAPFALGGDGEEQFELDGPRLRGDRPGGDAEVARGGQVLPARGELQAPDLARGLGHLAGAADLGAVGGVPEADDAVEVAGGQQPAVGAEGDAFDRGVVPPAGVQGPAGGHVPDAGGVVLRHRGEPRAVGAERDRRHAPRVAVQGALLRRLGDRPAHPGLAGGHR
jgi:hypothetical protein